MMDESYRIPTYKDGLWTYTDFESREEFRNYLDSIFKEPGQYEFDEVSLLFNKEATRFNKDGYYCSAAYKSKDYVTYWDTEKEKCRRGAIYYSGDKSWYLTRDYYMWLNFLPIFNKEKNKFGFVDIRDAQYHMALYEFRAEMHWRHSAIFKKRQIASSYFHAAKLVNQIWFEEGITLKMGASLRDYINEKGTWAFLEEYRNFLNDKTAWYRPMNPGKPMNWEQKVQEKLHNRWNTRGLKGRLLGLSFEQSATRGVGGPTKYFFYEEGGIAPTADQTFEYIRPAMRSGMITTGMFIIAGSVGDLDQCGPLKSMILKPEANDILPVKTDLLDEKNTEGLSGLFIPEHWSMPPHIDKYGNSLIKESLEAIAQQRAEWKRELTPELYQLRISQHPINIAEGFAMRKLSKFPVHLLSAQKRRIEEKEYPYQLVDLFRNDQGLVESRPTTKQPIKEFPVQKNKEDKEGAIQVWEPPVKDAIFSTYYASIDPVGEGKTTTSESLCSIYIYKNDMEVTRQLSDKLETSIERGRIVACWCGRFDDINKTHERLEMMLEWYNAWAVVENNVSLFIQYMIFKRKQKYLVPKDQIMFLKDLGANRNSFQEYGWKNTGQLFRSHLLSYLIEFLSEELDVETKPDGTVVKVTYGIERIPDLMAITEMSEYDDGLNVDRLVSLAALISFVRVQQSNRGYMKRFEKDPNQALQKSPNFSKLFNPFRHMGGSGGDAGSARPSRNPFKNFK